MYYVMLVKSVEIFVDSFQHTLVRVLDTLPALDAVPPMDRTRWIVGR